MKQNDLKTLYLTCFNEDSVEDANFLFEQVFSKAHLLKEELDGKTVSMLYLMDCTLNTQKGNLPYYYLYAACTHPDYRGKGIMGGLLQKAKHFAAQTGKKGIILKPAKPSLFEFYKNCGFLPFFKVASSFLSDKELLTFNDTDFSYIPIDKWWEQRQNVLSCLCDGFVCFPKDIFVAATDGCSVATNKKGAYVVYEIREKTLLCKECFFESGNGEAVFELATTLLRQNNLKNAELRFPPIKNEFIQNHTKTEYFSVISEIPDVPLKKPYHGFAFD